MRSRLDYPIINPVESVLISNKLPTKLLASTTTLTQSKHQNDTASFIFATPSQDCLKKLQKICPINVKSAGSDSNANLRTFIILTFQSVFNPQDDFYEKLFIDKITHQVPNITKKSHIFNHRHEEMSFDNMLKVISGFVKTLSNKKLKNPQSFDLLKELENLSIILDYTTAIFRAILKHYGQQNAEDFTKTVQDHQSYAILSEYFDLNFIQKESFYLFEENSLFCYKIGSEYVFGSYQSSVSEQVKKQKPVNKIKPKYEQNCRIQILECSMESGLMMVSSRHAQDQTPYFNSLAGEQFIFRSNERKQGSNEGHIKEKKLQNIYESKASGKYFDSKGSQFELNIYSEDKNQFFNNRYKSGKRSEDSNNDSGNHSGKTSKESNFPSNKVFLSNNTHNSKNISPLKKSFTDKSSLLETGTRQKTNSQKTVKSNQNTEVTNNKETLTQDNMLKIETQTHNCFQDKTFPWQNQERRLRRVQTIFYKTCSTCHRRFYRNQIQSNVMQIQINVIPKIQILKNQICEKAQVFSTKQAPEFLNKKFNKKITEIQTKNHSSRNVERSPRSNFRQPVKVPQLSWLSKRAKGQILNKGQVKASETVLIPDLSNKIDSNQQLSFKNQAKNDLEPTKKVLSAKNLFVKTKQSKEDAVNEQKNMIKVIQKNENKRPSCEKIEAQSKVKSFLRLKSQKELQKIKSIDKFDYFKGKAERDRVSLNEKNSDKKIELKNNQQVKGRQGLVLLDKIQNTGDKIERKQLRNEQKVERVHEKGKIEVTKSLQRRVPNFFKKDSLNIELDLIMNN